MLRAKASAGRQPINLNGSVIRALRWVIASRLAAQLLTWANTFLVIRLLSRADYGLATLAGLFASYLTLINEFGFSVALVQRQTRDPETLRHVFGALLALGALLAVGLIAAAPIIGVLVKAPGVVPLLRLISLQFLAMAISVVPEARLSMDLRLKEISIADVCGSLIGAAATLLSALHGAGAWSLIIGSVVLNFSRAIVLNLFSPWIVIPQLSFNRIRDFLGFSGLVLLERTLWYWYMEVDILLVGRLLGVAELGIYAVGRQLTSIPLERAMGIINSVSLPAFSTVKSDLDQVRRGYLKILRLGAGYAFPVFWGLGLVCQPAVRLLLGSKWLAAVPVIQLLCISMPLRMLNSFTSATVASIDRQIVSIKSLTLALIVIPLCITVGIRWGIVGVAAAWAIGFPLVYLFNASLMRRTLIIPFRQMLKAVLPAATAALAMVVVLAALDTMLLGSYRPSVHLAVAVPAGALIFGTTLWLVSRESAYEILELVRGIASYGAYARSHE